MVSRLLYRPHSQHPYLFESRNYLSIQNEKERSAQIKPLAIDSARVILDLPVAYSFLHPGTVSGKTVGACGTITSLIGLYQLWK